jgi:hypothetical protein
MLTCDYNSVPHELSNLSLKTELMTKLHRKFSVTAVTDNVG